MNKNQGSTRQFPGRNRRRDRLKKRGNTVGNSANSQSGTPVPVPEGLVFYCKSCEQIVDFHPANFNSKFPPENCCKSKAVVNEEKRSEMVCDLAYGTERSIKHFYKIKDDKFDKERREREEKAAKADKF